MDWHRASWDCTSCAHDRRGQQRPDYRESAHSNGGDTGSGAVNDSRCVNAGTLVLWTAGRGAWSIASEKRAVMRGDDDIHWANRSEHLLSRRLVAPLTRATIMFRSVKTE